LQADRVADGFVFGRAQLGGVDSAGFARGARVPPISERDSRRVLTLLASRHAKYRSISIAPAPIWSIIGHLADT
jgi:hypothetical protein